MAREAKKCRFPFESVMDGDRLVVKKRVWTCSAGDSQICECTFTPFLIIVPEGSPYIYMFVFVCLDVGP